MSTHANLLGEPPATLLPDLPEASQLVAEGTAAVEVAAKYPAFSLAWALLAEDALKAGRPVRRTPTRGPATTGGWTRCAATGGKGTARSPGRTPRTRGSCAAWPHSPGPPRRSARPTRQPAAGRSCATAATRRTPRSRARYCRTAVLPYCRASPAADRGRTGEPCTGPRVRSA